MAGNKDEEKYKDVREFHKHIGKIQQRIQDDLNKKHEDDYGCGIILYLLYKTGIRHGAKRDGATTGCCSLKVMHVTLFQQEQKYFVTLNIHGKCKIPYTGRIEISQQHHKVIKNLMQKKVKNKFINKSEDEDIFTKKSEQNAVNFLKDLNKETTNSNFTMKDFRTHFATIILERLLPDNKCNNKWEAITKFHKCINVVGAIMNHKKTETIAELNIYITNPNSTLRDYIYPRIIYSFCKRMGILMSDICEDAFCKSFKDAENTSADFKAFPPKDKNEESLYKVRESDEMIQTSLNNTSTKKYKIFDEFHEKIDNIRKRIDEDLQGDDTYKSKCALILSLLDKSGIKINFGTIEGTSGNCSVKAKDVKVVTKYFLDLDTNNKNEIPITEKVKENITGLKENKEDGDSLFTGITEEKVNEYLSEITSNDKFTMDIFQKYFAREIMKKKLSAMKVKEEEKIIAKFNKIVNIVATIMDIKKKVIVNDLEIYVPDTESTLRDFVDPAIIDSFCKGKDTSAAFTAFLKTIHTIKIIKGEEIETKKKPNDKKNDQKEVKAESKCKNDESTNQ